MRNIKLTVEYDGTNYLGWQRQPQGMTIQEALETAIERLTGEKTSVTGAGRTDAGVHARGQTANFKTDSALAVERFQGAINALLPRDIAVRETMEVPDAFNSRYSALSKHYRYMIWNRRVRPALERAFCWHLRWGFDHAAAREAAQALLGTHDFVCFESSNAESRTTVRTITRAEWREDEPGRVTFDIEANAFLYNMVRAIVGTLTDIARGKVPPERMAEILASKDRTMAGRTAPAQGLCLMEVHYPEEFVWQPPE